MRTRGSGDTTILYLDCSAGYMALCVCENSHNCTPKEWIFLYVIKKGEKVNQLHSMLIMMAKQANTP